MAMANIKESKSAFLLWTPFQIFGAIHFIVDKNLIGKADAYIIGQFSDADDIVNKVINSGIFSSVKYTHLQDIEKNHKFWELIGLFISPKAYLKHIFNCELPAYDYENIYYSVPSRFNDIFVLAHHKAKVYGLDDGIGSYINDVYLINLGKKYELIKKILHKNHTVQAAYLFCPEFYNGPNHRPIFNLLDDNNTFSRVTPFIHNIFNYTNVDNYIAYKYIYLNQPVSDFADIATQIRVEKTIFNLISTTISPNLLVRLHPRETHYELYDGNTIDQFNPMWELVSSDIIDEKYCLIACFSTAQFTPKLLFNKEPMLVFTYPLYTTLSDESKTNFSLSVARLRNIYTHPEKIIVVDKLSDLSKVFH